MTGAPRPGRYRDPLLVWLAVIASFGIYAVVHHYLINRELSDFGIEVDPRLSALAFFPGIVILLPFLVTVYRTGERIAVAQEAEDLRPTAAGILSVITTIGAFAGSAYHQSQLNRVWRLQHSTKGDT